MEEQYVYVFIGSIPGSLRAADLRIYFKSFIDSCAFKCFHFRHRPDTIEFRKLLNISVPCVVNTSCCVINVRKNHNTGFIEKYCSGYNAQQKNCLFISPLEDSIISDFEKISSTLIELNPPFYLPNGNVGTPLEVMNNLISLCKVPASAIKALRLCIPETRTCEISYDYSKIGENVLPSTLPFSIDTFPVVKEPTVFKLKEKKQENDQEEDWERHETFHNDVDEQERSKERLYEEEKEVVWEKGSSGLVYYTDTQYWNEVEGKNDFDESTVDDWDVDVGVYDEKIGGDIGERELMEVRRLNHEKRSGCSIPNNPHIKKKQRPKEQLYTGFCEFEKYTKGFGSQQLIKSGWKKGTPLNKGGIIEPLSNESRKSFDRSGLGFYKNNKLPLCSKNKYSSHLVPHNHYNFIKLSTIYDKTPEPENMPSISVPPTTLKFRHKSHSKNTNDLKP